MDKDFYINQRFFVEPGGSAVTDLVKGKKTRLEPRLIQLLCLLAEKNGKTVTREELISTIWQDYGGGDEGLTQGISMLRKTLLDRNKQLIQTVPKKGYILDGLVSLETNTKEIKTRDKKSVITHKKWIIVISSTILVLSFLILYFKNKANTEISTTPSEVPYPVNTVQEEISEENETNTIITRASDTTVYKLVMIGDRPPKFYINNQRVLEDKWGPYMPLINSLKRKLIEKRKTMK